MAKTDPPVAYRGTGKRKNSVARVMLVPGAGHGDRQRPLAGASTSPARRCSRSPWRRLRVSGTEASFDVRARIDGGGIAGQAGALRHGISRALLEADESCAPS